MNRRPMADKFTVTRTGSGVTLVIRWWRRPILLDEDEAAYLGSELLKAAGRSSQGGPRPSGRNARARRAVVVGAGRGTSGRSSLRSGTEGTGGRA